MAFRMQALPSAKEDFKHFCDTYGEQCSKCAVKWRNAIVRGASGKASPGSIDVVNDILDTGSEGRLDKSDAEKAFGKRLPGTLEYARARFSEAGIVDRVRATSQFFTSRKPPWQLCWTMNRFHCLGGKVPVDLYALYEINRVEKLVVFEVFVIYSGHTPC